MFCFSLKILSICCWHLLFKEFIKFTFFQSTAKPTTHLAYICKNANVPLNALPTPPGQERFGNMTRVYYKEAVGAFVVFDVTRGSTFEAVSKWKHDLDSKVKLANGNPIPSVLLANKCDQKKESSNSTTLMDNFCKETGFLGWFETSAKVSGIWQKSTHAVAQSQVLLPAFLSISV